MVNQTQSLHVEYITEVDVKLIVAEYGYINNTTIEHYEVKNASKNKMLGFLADYLKLKITLKSNGEEKVLNLFIKAVSRTNAAKAKLVEDVHLFDKELKYYELIHGIMKVPGLKPWTARFITAIKDLIVLEDLYALNYEMCDKYTKFDEQHTLQALNTMARFHANTFIFEERKTRELQRPYRVYEDYGEYLAESIYTEADPWFSQCREGSLGVVKLFSKYSQDKEKLEVIENRWRDVFNSVLTLHESDSDRAVISHCDLWNNNILFHYEKGSEAAPAPDDCVLVDFQMVRLLPPAADVMVLLNCNLDPQYRKNKLAYLLNYYYDELKAILLKYDINLNDIMKREAFISSAKKYDLWGLVLKVSYMQIVLPEDKLLKSLINDSDCFQDVIAKDKISFMTKLMEESEDYKKRMMGIFEEFIDDYILIQ